MKTIFGYFIAILALSFVIKVKAQIPKPDHVVVVILENHAFDQIAGSKAAPYINSLIRRKDCALFTNSYAVTHPSQPNYLALFAGTYFGITDDDLPKMFPFTAPNLGAELLTNGYTFAGYSEDLPSTGYNGRYKGLYARKHNPWVNWQNSKENGIPDSLNLPLTEFPKDYNNLPTVSFVIPNQHNDMHNGKDPDRIKICDSWMKTHLSGYIKWAEEHNSLLVVTFDEDNDLEGNHIPTFILGQPVKGGKYGQKINHYNVLRTIEDMYSLPHAGNSAEAAVINGCWRIKK